jgi:hypothetical protein
VVGAGSARDRAYRPIYINVKQITIAVLAVNGINVPSSGNAGDPSGWQIADWDLPELIHEIKLSRKQADAVIVMVHWGNEFENWEGPAQKEAAVDLVKAGADVVVGSHPHVVQGTQVVTNGEFGEGIGFVAYSLGNFVFDQYNEATKTGLALSLFFDRKGLKAVRPEFLHAGPEPRWFGNNLDKALIERYRPEPDWDTFKCSHDECDPIEGEIPRSSGHFYAGKIDLTGDAKPETVRLVDEQVQIFNNGELAWKSPDEWKVLDAAIGDPNLDGRGEVALALEKPDGDGAIRSHPFLIGYRGGIYRQVWGGSAVHYPITALEIADLDGDLDQELVILEKRAGDKRAVTVWRWNGWVFSQVWSSPEESYLELVIERDNTGQPVIHVSKNW